MIICKKCQRELTEYCCEQAFLETIFGPPKIDETEDPERRRRREEAIANENKAWRKRQGYNE